jgi:hypothetical protein
LFYFTSFTAITLKKILLKMVVQDFTKNCKINEFTSEEMCCFLATLMHSEITTLNLPALNSTLPPMDFAFKWLAQSYSPHAGRAPVSLKELHEASCGVLMLINAIGAQCSSLKSLSIMAISCAVPMPPLTKGSIFGTAFFRVLPRLTELDINCYQCGDWALKQIGTHATNLV